MTFYFNNKNQPEKSMPKQVNKPITDSTVKFTDEPVSTSNDLPRNFEKADNKNVEKNRQNLKKSYEKLYKDGEQIALGAAGNYLYEKLEKINNTDKNQNRK